MGSFLNSGAFSLSLSLFNILLTNEINFLKEAGFCFSNCKEGEGGEVGMYWQVCSIALICNQQRKCLLMRHESMQPDCKSANRDVRKLFSR